MEDTHRVIPEADHVTVIFVHAGNNGAERIFSAAGLTVNRLHTRLTPDHKDMLIFLNKNE